MKKIFLLICLFLSLLEVEAQTTCQSNLQMTCDQKRRKEEDIHRDSVALADLEIQVERLKAGIKKSEKLLCALNEDEKALTACVAEEQRVQAIDAASQVLKAQYEHSQSVLKGMKETKASVRRCPPGVNCN